MLGFFTAVTEIVTLDAMKESLLDSVPKGTEELNMSALMNGYKYGRNLVGAKKKSKKK